MHDEHGSGGAGMKMSFLKLTKTDKKIRQLIRNHSHMSDQEFVEAFNKILDEGFEEIERVVNDELPGLRSD